MAINPIEAGKLSAPQTKPSEGGGAHFAEALTQFMLEVNSDQIKAGNQMKQLLVEG